MAELSFTDKTKINKFLTPSATDKGYILNFANNDLRDFISSATGFNIYEKGKYDDYGTSKAKRLNSFFEKEDDHVVGKVLLELVEYQKTLEPQYHSSEIQPDEIVEIANKLLQGSIGKEEDSAGEVHFEEIRKQILRELEKAEFTIWMAVAWFTDPVLFNSLVVKKYQGLNVQIIIIDDKINRSSGLDYDQFENYKLPLSGPNSINKMHHKFCVIDSKTVIHGSYNWTKTAKFNGETVEISSGYSKAEKFLKEFMRLKLQEINRLATLSL